MVIRFEQDSYQDCGICAFGQWDLDKILARKCGIDPPLSGRFIFLLPPPPLRVFQTSYWNEYFHFVTLTALETFRKYLTNSLAHVQQFLCSFSPAIPKILKSSLKCSQLPVY